MRINEKKIIRYINVNKDGILISCLNGTYINLYEIKGKKYKHIQTIRPYPLKIDIIGIFNGSFTILKYIELKNGDLAILAWAYALCFYKKNKNSKKYSSLNKFNETPGENITDLCELDDKEYCISFKYSHLIKFLDMNSQKITGIIKLNDFYFSQSHNEILLMNKKDLLAAGHNNIIIIDI